MSRRLLLAILIIGLVILTKGQPVVHASLWIDGMIPKPPSDQASFMAYLERAGLPAYSRSSRYPASYATFHDYKLLVYGTPSQVPGNRYSATYQQYAMLGFSYDERPVTNSLFPDDAPGGVTQTSPFRWEELDLGNAAAESWLRLGEARRRTLKSMQLFYRGQPYGWMDCPSLGLGERKAIVLAPPSWHLGSALYTEHYLQRNGYLERRYATFTCSGSGGAELDCAVEVLTPPGPDQAYAFDAGKDELRIAYRVTGGIRALTGLASDADIILRGVGTDDGLAYGDGHGPFVYTGELVLNRAMLGGADIGVGQIHATAFVVSAMGDIVLQEQVRYLPLRSRKAVQPLTVTADITGAIGFFSGARMMSGRTPAPDSRRFLGLETAWLSVRFSKPIASWSYTFLGETHIQEGAADQTSFQVPIRMPLQQDTLDWQDVRLHPPLTIEIAGTDPEAPEAAARTALAGIELTGDVYDLLYLQTAN